MLDKTFTKFFPVIIIILILLFGIVGLLGYLFLNKYEPTLSYIKNYNQIVSESNVSAPESAVAVKKNQSIELIFGGDVMLARHVQTIQAGLNDYSDAWQNIAEVLRRADLAVINLESPIINTPPYPREGFIFRARPENISGLKFAGVDLVNLANNHFGNAGQEGMEYTFNILKDNNIDYFGAGRNEAEAYQAKIIKVKTKKFGFLGQTYNVGYKATGLKPGVAVYNLEKLKKEIKSLRNKVDFLIVQFHGGREYTYQPNREQVLFAHAAIDAGADLVIGHHPHWIQTIEKYKGKYIFYSLGNLIFDQNWSQKTKEGLLVKVVFGDNLSFKLLPVIIKENFQPVLVDKERALEILKYINITSTSISVER